MIIASDGTHSSPHGRDDIGLCQLNDDAAGAELVTGVPRVPVVVPGVAVEEGIAAPTDALQDRGICSNTGHVLCGNCACVNGVGGEKSRENDVICEILRHYYIILTDKPLIVELEGSGGVQAGKRHQVKAAVH